MASDVAPNITLYETALGGFKHDGCALLVTGDVPATTLQAATRTLFGAPGEGRRRVLALTDPAAGAAADLLPASAHPAADDVRVVDLCDRAREAGATRPDRSPFAPPGDDGMDAVHLETSRALVDVTPRDPAGGEVRLSVASLPPLLERYDREDVERFVRATAAQVRGVRGMAHYLLPVVDGAGWVRRLAPLFDARIELRSASDGPPEHRWHLPDRELASPWRDLPVTADRGWHEL